MVLSHARQSGTLGEYKAYTEFEIRWAGRSICRPTGQSTGTLGRPNSASQSPAGPPTRLAALARAAHPCYRSRELDVSITRRCDKSMHRSVDGSMDRRAPPNRSIPRPTHRFQPPAGLPSRRPARLGRLARVAHTAAGARLGRARRDAEKSCSGPWPFFKIIVVTDWGSTSP